MFRFGTHGLFFFFFLTFSDFWQMLNEAINQMMCLWKVQNLK